MALTRELRSLSRVTPLLQVTDEERYERLLNYYQTLQQGPRVTHQRPFVVPNEIFARLAAEKAAGTHAYTRIECLNDKLLLDIFELLCGNDQIMAALACRSFARITVSTITTKYANICRYNLSRSEKRRVGVVLHSNHPYFHLSDHPSPMASLMDQCLVQFLSLRHRLEAWMGPSLKYCNDCGKYRLKSQDWWKGFIAHETPDPTRLEEQSWRISHFITNWMNEFWVKSCPIHDLLAEDETGRRLV